MQVNLPIFAQVKLLTFNAADFENICIRQRSVFHWGQGQVSGRFPNSFQAWTGQIWRIQELFNVNSFLCNKYQPRWLLRRNHFEVFTFIDLLIETPPEAPVQARAGHTGVEQFSLKNSAPSWQLAFNIIQNQMPYSRLLLITQLQAKLALFPQWCPV